MIIVVDLVEERLLIAQPDDFTRFSVAVEGGGAEGSLAQVVHASGLGRLQPDGGHVAVDPVALRALAGPAATPEWDEGFAGMRAYAAGKGWVDADGAILAHVEWHEGVG
ncbi:MAG TPA: hypothetical protein VND70_08980 [Acidimicrobiales bacterium]|nr:hypothetical protein [Acidimicrobiales bacterium]